MSTTVTLRRAAKIRNRLTQHLAELRSKLHNADSIVINIYDGKIGEKISEQTDKYNELMTRFMTTSQVLFGLRNRIDIVNAECGINSLLAEQNQLKGQLAIVNRVAQSTAVTPNLDDLVSRIEGTKSRNAASTYVRDEVSVPCISHQMVAAAKIVAQQTQVRLDEIQDQIESLNANRTVEVTPSDLALMQSERLI
jgi:hypothetical protein